MSEKTILIIGTGIAALSAAYVLSKDSNYNIVMIECENTVGGLAKTYETNGMKYDIGPHRYFSKDERIFSFWGEILGYQGKPAKDDIILERDILNPRGEHDPETEDKVMLKRRRFSRIYYKNKFYDYPVKINLNTILNMGIFQTIKCGFSYLKSCVIKLPENNLEKFMINRFGRVLYETFFEFYTQKVWGRHPNTISKEWGSQRIKGLSLIKAVLSKFSLKKETSLIEEYYYPKFGSGQICNELANAIKANGGQIYLNSRVVGLKVNNNHIESLQIKNSEGEYSLSGDYIISSMPVKDLINSMDNCPERIREIASDLPYRDYQLISFKVKDFNLKNQTDWKTIGNICPDSWIYIQDREVRVGRIYIPKNFSPYLSNDVNDTLISMEYFCSEGDELWNMTDEEIFNFGADELIKLKALKDKNDIISTDRIKIEKAYPAYFDSYKYFDEVKEYINSIDNICCIGRNGQHRYNNLDQSTLCGIEAANVIINNKDKKNLWNVTTESGY